MSQGYWRSWRRWGLFAVAVLQLPQVQAVMPPGWLPLITAAVAVGVLLRDAGKAMRS